MKKLLAVCFSVLALVLMITSPVAAAEQLSVQKMDAMAEQALQLSRAQKYDEAGKILERIKLNIGFLNSDAMVTPDAIEVLSRSLAQAEKSIKVQQSNEDAKATNNSILSFRLTVDAMTDENNPLWTKKETELLETLDKAETARLDNDMKAFDVAVDDFITVFNTVSPAMSLNTDKTDFDNINKKITHLEKYRNQVYMSVTANSEIVVIKSDLKKMMSIVVVEKEEPSIWWVIITTGSIIFVTLSYVGFRKYSAEKEQPRGRS